MRPLAALLAVVVLATCGAVSAAEPGMRGDVFDPAGMPVGSSGSLVAAVDGDLVECEGWGLADRAEQIDADCDTVYDIGSITKQFTAAAIVKLQMMGRLRVRERIGRFLDGVPRDKRAITVEELLTHTSGLVGALGDDYERLSRAGLVRRAMASDLRSAPGTTYHYSNVGYSLLAVIIEKVSGDGYEEFLSEHLFEPAGMTSTGYVLPVRVPADLAVEYDEDGHAHGRPDEHPWAADGPYWNLRGNGGLLSTARDMYRWYVALRGVSVLDRAAKGALFRARVREGDADSWYAYGWVVLNTPYGPAQWHNGGNGWSYAEVVRLPDEDAFVFWVTNQARSQSGGWNLERGRLTSDVVTRLLG